MESQVLTDLLAEWIEIQQPASTSKTRHLTMYFDGSLKLGEVGSRVHFILLPGEHLKYVLQNLWLTRYREVEYYVLLHGLCLPSSLGIEQVIVYDDSIVVITSQQKIGTALENPWALTTSRSINLRSCSMG